MRTALLVVWGLVATLAFAYEYMHARGADAMRDRALQACTAEE